MNLKRSGPSQDQKDIDPGLCTLAPHPFSSPGTKTPRQSTDPRKRGDERVTLFLHLPSTGKAGIRPVRLSRRQGENCVSSVASEETPGSIPRRAGRPRRMCRKWTRGPILMRRATPAHVNRVRNFYPHRHFPEPASTPTFSLPY